MSAGFDVLELAPADLRAALPPWESRTAANNVGVAVIAGSARDWEAARAGAPGVADELRSAPLITVGVVSDAPAEEPVAQLAGECDVVLGLTKTGADLDARLRAMIASLEGGGAPALVAAQLLRSPSSQLCAESFAYSMLLWSEDFARWRAGKARGAAQDPDADRIRLSRTGRAWTLTLTRTTRHNAFDARMREELCDALDAIAAAEPAPVVILGAGPSFCSGGDLDEFGTAESPVAAHLVRSCRSVARRLKRMAGRLVIGVHGHCLGAGVEFAAFAHRVIASDTATFSLPEMSLGLNLGAGGTASIPARIGRHRTLELLLSREGIDAATALRWGLVDEVVSGDELSARCHAVAEGLA